MAGYDGFSMSNNARSAYRSGFAPASKIPGVPAKLIKEFCGATEWHHTSKNYNCTDFFNIGNVRATFGLVDSEECEADPRAVAALAAWKAEKGGSSIIHDNCRVEWLEWSGTRNHAKCEEKTASGCRVAVKGQTATITLPTGFTFVKRLSTNGFRFIKE